MHPAAAGPGRQPASSAKKNRQQPNFQTVTSVSSPAHPVCDYFWGPLTGSDPAKIFLTFDVNSSYLTV